MAMVLDKFRERRANSPSALGADTRRWPTFCAGPKRVNLPRSRRCRTGGRLPEHIHALGNSGALSRVRGLVCSYFVLDVIIAPENAQQTHTPPIQPPSPAPTLDDVDRRIIEAIRELGPVKTWSLLNWLAEDEGTRSRADGREARRALWERVRRLKRLGLVFGAGRNELIAVKPDRQPTRPRPRPRRRGQTVTESPGLSAVSVDKSRSLSEQPDLNYPFQRHLTATDSVTSRRVEKSGKIKSVITPDEASAAARTLAKMPRRQSRKWTGWLHGEHFWRGRPVVVLPNGEVTGLYWANRPAGFYSWMPTTCLIGRGCSGWPAGSRMSGVSGTRLPSRSVGSRLALRKPPAPPRRRRAGSTGFARCAPGTAASWAASPPSAVGELFYSYGTT